MRKICCMAILMVFVMCFASCGIEKSQVYVFPENLTQFGGKTADDIYKEFKKLPNEKIEMCKTSDGKDAVAVTLKESQRDEWLEDEKNALLITEKEMESLDENYALVNNTNCTRLNIYYDQKNNITKDVKNSIMHCGMVQILNGKDDSKSAADWKILITVYDSDTEKEIKKINSPKEEIDL